jgi:periplasmic protein TonB
VPFEEKPAFSTREIAPDPNLPQQRKRMAFALLLMLVTLAVVLVKNRHTLFPEAVSAVEPQSVAVQDPDNQPSEEVDLATPPSNSKSSSPAPAKKRPSAEVKKPGPAKPDAPNSNAPIVSRAVLPPLEVEVVAGDQRRSLSTSGDSVKVDTSSGVSPGVNGSLAYRAPARPPVQAQASVNTPTPAGPETPAKAAERVRLSPQTLQALVHPVEPNYPLLARQMKVQGAVILDALISRDGSIQDLRIVSGPTILASAAMEAVRQWRFKPYYQEGEAVETQAHITVNFTISTN